VPHPLAPPRPPRVLALLCLALLAGSCRTLPRAGPPAQVRFLLTFDDGPAVEDGGEATARVLATLADNPLQPGIVGLFFVQTGWEEPGAAAVGRALLGRTAAAGHLLGLHGSGEAGHREHPSLEPGRLAASLQAGAAEVVAAGAGAPTLVRPPNWRHDEDTRAVYRRASLELLLTDAAAFDGSLVQFQVDPDGGERIDRDLRCLRERLERGTVAPLDGVLPVVMTFHDPNPYTARHLGRYLAALLRSARAAGFAVAEPPFYASAREAARAAHARAASTHGWTNAFMRRCPD
jgi:peptidoglycan/xylan/chitin deacetylase (PgdA/CDA1 family)